MSAYGSVARIKDIVQFQGIRENMLMGYGLVVGLNGTGDNLNNAVFTQKGLENFLEKLGVNTAGSQLKTKNVAAVTITAILPPFSRLGSRIDVTVSTLGDAKNLQGGILLASPLLGADGNVYAVAQGAVATGGFSASTGGGSSIQKGVPTNGFIANGAIIEKEIEFQLNSLNSILLALRNPDLSTARNIALTINDFLGESSAEALDSGTVKLSIPFENPLELSELLARIEPLEVTTDQIARVIIDESSGTIVMGENVRIDTVAVAQGNLIVKIDTTPVVSQPNTFAPPGAKTVSSQISKLKLQGVEPSIGDKLTVISKNTNLGDLVNGLNALGVGPRDLITILRNIKAAGALHAEVESR